MGIVEIEKGSTRAQVHIDVNSPYGSYIKAVTRGILTDYVFDHQMRRNVVDKKYSKFDPLRNILYVPIEALPRIEDAFANAGAFVHVAEEKLVKPRRINVKMKPEWQDKPNQVDGINYLSNLDIPRKGLALQPGIGKTYSSIKAAVNVGYATMIVVSRLQDQWIRSLIAQTTVGDNYYLIEGQKSLVKLMESDLKPDFIIISLETLRCYVQEKDNYKDLPKYEKFIEYFGIGTKIMDEVHLNFHACTQIDLKSNIVNNIYLTATFCSSSKSTERVFNLVYPKSMRFGEDRYEKYALAFTYRYSLGINERKVVRKRGYDHCRYEKELMTRQFAFDDFMQRVMLPIIRQHYVNIKNDKEKILIYFVQIEMIDKVLEYLSKALPEFKTNKFIAGVPDSVLTESDIILTTPKKAGVGTDIASLRTVINTISCKAKTVVEQIFGRLRRLPNGVVPEYVDLCNDIVTSHRRHLDERAFILHDIAVKYDTKIIY